MIVLGSVFLAALTIKNSMTWSFFALVINSVAILVLVSIFIIARTKVPQTVLSFIVLIFWILFCVLNIWNGKAQGANFLYIYIVPPLAIMLLGMRLGVTLSVILLCITAAQMFIPGLSHYTYQIDVSSRMVNSYILVLAAMIVTEITRKTKDRLIDKQSHELQNFNDNLQIMVEEKTKSVLDLQSALLKTMAELVECRDDITGGHIERTQRGIKILLDEIERSGVYREETNGWNINLILQSCQLHDVGKISISDNILKKPAKLNKEEFEEMKKHASFGEQIIGKIETLAKESDFLKYAKIFACCHHEKWDGSGYPRGLKKNEIPLLGRVMAIADVYDALISVRPYKNAFTHEEAVQIIKEQSGTQFDPVLVDIFDRTAEQFRG
jgi:HD-GYP domain-containing protein (c-di-GMP phosphodiesterase class II)